MKIEQNRIAGQAVKSPDELHKVIYCRKKVHHPFPNPRYRKKQFPRSGNYDMANRETRQKLYIQFRFGIKIT